MSGAPSDEGSGLICHSLSPSIVHRQEDVICTITMCKEKCIYTVYTRPLSVQAENSRSCPTLGSSGYNASLVTWTVVRLLYFLCRVSPCPVLRTFAFSWFWMTSACCLDNFVIIIDIRNTESLMQFADQWFMFVQSENLCQIPIFSNCSAAHHWRTMVRNW
jgi:hypothetical protein